MGTVPEDSRTLSTVGIIGCGNIAAGYDAHNHSKCLTHCSAFTSVHSKVVALCDIDAARVRKVALDRGVEQTFTDPFKMLSTRSFDVVVIATPPSLRPELIHAALESATRSIIIEKPLARDRDDLDKIAALILDSKKLVLVNFIRRWGAVYEMIANHLATDPPVSVMASYSKDYLNAGSHCLDLLFALFGSYCNASYSCPFLELTFAFENKDLPCVIRQIPAVEYNLIDFEITCSNSVLRVFDNSRLAQVYIPASDTEYPMVKTLKLRTAHDNLMADCMLNLRKLSLGQIFRSYQLSTIESSRLIQTLKDRFEIA